VAAGRGHVGDRPPEDVDRKQRRYYRISTLGRRVVAAEAARMKSLVEGSPKGSAGMWMNSWMDDLLKDVRFGLRLLARHPGFGVLVTLTRGRA